MKAKSLIFPFLLAILMAACSKGEAVAPLPSTEERLAAPADAAYGQYLFRECAICHERSPGAGNRVGPNLWGVYGQPAASNENFAYSGAMRRADLVWDDDNLDKFLERPGALVPGTRMSFGGEKDPANRRDIIAYLKTLK